MSAPRRRARCPLAMVPLCGPPRLLERRSDDLASEVSGEQRRGTCQACRMRPTSPMAPVALEREVAVSELDDLVAGQVIDVCAKVGNNLSGHVLVMLLRVGNPLVGRVRLAIPVAQQQDRASWRERFADLSPVVRIPGLVRPSGIAGLVRDLMGVTLRVRVLNALRSVLAGAAEEIDDRPTEVDHRNDVPAFDRLRAEGVSR